MPKRSLLDDPRGRSPPSKKVKFTEFESPDRYYSSSRKEEEKKGFDSSELMKLDAEEIATLRSYKKEATNDMENLSHLDSAESGVFEKAGELSDEEDETFERFSEKDTMRRCMRDPVSKHRDSNRKEQQNEVEDHWYNEFMEAKKKEKGGTPKQRPTSAPFLIRRTPSNKMEDDEDLDALEHSEILRRMKEMVKEKETVAAALRRLSGMPQGKRRNQRNRETEKNVENAQMVEKLTELASVCTAKRFLPDVFSATREDLLKTLGKLNNTNETETPPTTISWEYKAPTGELFGPFTSEAMLGWKNQNCFPDSLQVRRVGDFSFSSISSVSFS